MFACDAIVVVFFHQRNLSALSSFCPVTAGGQLRPEVSAPLRQRGISPDVQETDQAGERQRGNERGAGQVQVAVRRCRRLAHRGGGEGWTRRKDLDIYSRAILYKNNK